LSQTPAAPRRAFFGRLVAAVTGGAWLAGLKDARPAQAAPEGFAQPYIGEIRLFGGVTPPAGWMMCEGQLLSIDEQNTLYNLIGTVYGGDGQSTFALPDLRGRAPIHMGSGFTLGDISGSEEVSMLESQIPSHTHTALGGSSPGNSDNPAGRAPAKNAAGVTQYAGGADTNLSAAALLSSGGSQAHNNMQPYLTVSYMISLYGFYPPGN
jgi:microcystin-dependent protein